MKKRTFNLFRQTRKVGTIGDAGCANSSTNPRDLDPFDNVPGGDKDIFPDVETSPDVAVALAVL
jgi:hypothetical protein